MTFETRQRSTLPDVMAPDGSEVRILAAGARGSMAQFTLSPGAVSKAVAHRSVEEVWLVISGHGRMWRQLGAVEETVGLKPGTSITIPVGTHFQFRNDGTTPLECVGATMPPWPGMNEAYPVASHW